MSNGGVLMMQRRGASVTLVYGLLVLMGMMANLAVSAAASAAAACPNAGLRVGRSAGLADCRAYEQVTPSDKGGFAGIARATPFQVSTSGSEVAYRGNEAFPGASGNTALFAAHVSARTSDGWKTIELTPAVPRGEVLKTYVVGYTFADDLSQAILQVPVVPLTPGATPNAYNLYRRSNDGSYSLVNAATAAESVEDVCGPGLLSLCWQFVDVSAFAAASSDLNQVLFESNAKFTSEAPGASVESLYESSAGHVTLVGILPDGQPATTSTAGAGSSAFYSDSAQRIDGRVEHAMSQNGSNVVFQAPADGGAPDPAQSGMTEVYDRIDGSDTIELSAPAPGAIPAVATPQPATFWAASADGSRVFFTSSAELTTESNTGTANGGEDLYEYSLQTNRLTDLTVANSPEDVANGAMVRGVVDVSSDGTYVYFVAAGVLDPGKGVDGQPNLYMVHDRESPVFITTLSSSGTCALPDNQSADACDWTVFPAELEAYVTPDGRHLAFMSTMSLPTANFPSGYDNIDANTGVADSEVYEYTAATSREKGQLICASCDPSGGQPIGNALLGGISSAALTPEVGLLKYRGISTPFYRVRTVSDNGARVFYSAPTSPSVQFERVYEYEHEGEGSCSARGGCQYLLSGGFGEAETFLGANADGADVYVATPNRLAATDQDDLQDVYDVHVDGGIPVTSASVCESNCRQASEPPALQRAVSGSVGPSGSLSSTHPPIRHTARKRCDKHHRLRRGRCVKLKTPTKAKRTIHTKRKGR